MDDTQSVRRKNFRRIIAHIESAQPKTVASRIYFSLASCAGSFSSSSFHMDGRVGGLIFDRKGDLKVFQKNIKKRTNGRKSAARIRTK